MVRQHHGTSHIGRALSSDFVCMYNKLPYMHASKSYFAWIWEDAKKQGKDVTSLEVLLRRIENHPSPYLSFGDFTRGTVRASGLARWYDRWDLGLGGIPPDIVHIWSRFGVLANYDAPWWGHVVLALFGGCCVNLLFEGFSKLNMETEQIAKEMTKQCKQLWILSFTANK